jgi:single-strand DNA-binding protein
MKGFNKVFLIGYLGGDPELEMAKGGSPFTRLSLAVHRPHRNENGEWDSQTEWHRVMVWGKKAEICADHLQKGSPLAIEGHLSQYKREQEGGGTTTHTSIIAEEVHFLPNPRQAALPVAQASS